MEMDSYEIIRFKYVRKRQKKPFFIYARLRELGRQDKGPFPYLLPRLHDIQDHRAEAEPGRHEVHGPGNHEDPEGLRGRRRGKLLRGRDGRKGGEGA